MSRLLFAAARGARIQGEFHNWTTNRNEWRTVGAIELLIDHDSVYRIHPDDAHLQYGPISTAMRETGLQDVQHVWKMPHGLEVWLSFSDHIDLNAADDDTTSNFLLILAEALADEGL
jgi:hypothetical protein